MSVPGLDDSLRSLLDDFLAAGRRQAVQDPAIRTDADRLGLTRADLDAVLDVDDEELWEPCRRGIAELQRAEADLAAYRETARFRLSERPANRPERSPQAKSRDRSKQWVEDARDRLDELVEQSLARDPRYQALIDRRDAARSRLPELLMEQSLLPRLRLALNERQRELTRGVEARRYRFRQPLHRGINTAGLRVRDPGEEMLVSTRATEELDALTDAARSGRLSVGVAGPRGSGKSTLLSATRARWTAGVSVSVPAPTRYVPREFLLYLYDQVCRQVLNPRWGSPDTDLTDPSAVPAAPPTRLAATSLLTLVLLPAVGTAVGLALLLSTVPAAAEDDDPLFFGLGGALVLLAGVPLLLYVLQRRAWPMPGTADTTTTGTLLLVFDLLRWRLPGVRRLLTCVALTGAALLAAAAADGVTVRQALAASLVATAVITSVFWQLGRRTDESAPTTDETLLPVFLVRARRLVLVMATAAAQLVACAAGVALLAVPDTAVHLDLPLVLGSLITTASATGLTVGIRVRRLLQREARELEAPDEDPASRLARAALTRIRYQRTMQSGWSSAVKISAPSWFPVGMDAATSGQSSEAETPMSVPEIVDGIKTLIARRGPALVVIDELDKVESVEEARDFLNEIKGVLEAPDTRFLVSMSEDAIANFERRGLPFRDVFDSAFDEVLSVPYLSPAEAVLLLAGRITDVPAPFGALAYCQSGGLPRDLIRGMSRIIALAETGPSDGVPVAEIARRLLHRDLSGKTEAVTAAIRSLQVEPAVSDVLRALHVLDRCEPPEPRRRPCLLDATWLAPLERLDAVLPRIEGERDADLSERRTLLRLTVELVGYFYYCRTMLELFDVEGPSVDRLIAVVDEDHGKALGELVRARQNFAVNPFLAWGQVNDFRARPDIALARFDLPAALRPPGTEPPTTVPVPPTGQAGYAPAG